MSKEFNPQLVVLDIAETYAVGSGESNPKPPTLVPSTPLTPSNTTSPATPIAGVECAWHSHNSGSHSDGHIYVSQHPFVGELMIVKCTTNFPLISISSGAAEAVITGTNSFTLTRRNHFNTGDNVYIDYTIKSNVPEYGHSATEKGAVGVSSAPTDTKYQVTVVSVEHYEK